MNISNVLSEDEIFFENLEKQIKNKTDLITENVFYKNCKECIKLLLIIIFLEENFPDLRISYEEIYRTLKLKKKKIDNLISELNSLNLISKVKGRQRNGNRIINYYKSTQIAKDELCSLINNIFRKN